MKPEQIEELLRAQPPDERDHEGEPIVGREPVVRATAIRPAPATTRVRRPVGGALLTAGSMVAVALVVIVLVLGQLAARPPVEPSASPSTTARRSPNPTSEATPGSSPVSDVIPWLDATPAPTPTPERKVDPGSLPGCTAADLALAASGWAGATGSLAGGASVINLSSRACTVSGKPSVDLRSGRGIDAGGAMIARGTGKPATGRLLVVLPPGGVAGVITVWGNWCGDPPSRPLFVRLTLPGGAGELQATVHEQPWSTGEAPRCDAPGKASTFGVPQPFSAPEPWDGGYEPEACTADDLEAWLGRWNAGLGTSYANLALLNTGGVDCQLATAPVLELRDADGKLVVTAPGEADASPKVLPPGWAAIGRVGYADWCTAPPATPLRLDLRVGSGMLKVEATSGIGLPACQSAPPPPLPTLFLDADLAVPGAPAAPEPDFADLLPVSVAFSDLPAVSPGATLEYTVTFTDLDAKPVNLAGLCPDYTVRVFLPNATAAIESRFALNCERAGVLAQDGRATFAMRLPIPADAAVGTATLVWQLGERGPSAKVTFRVAP
jgi:Domain of unknown function (DUF4232)